MKAGLKWLGIALAVAGSATFIVHVMASLNFADLRAHLSPRAVASLLAAILLYSAVVPLGALAWQRILAGLGPRAGYASLLSIMLTTQAGKYLPGNVGQHIGRIALSLSLGIPAALLGASMVYELALLLAAAPLTAAAAAALSQPGLVLLLDGRGSTLAVAAALAVIVLAALPLASRLVPMLLRRIPARIAGRVAALPDLPVATMLGVIGIFALCLVCIGASLGILALGLIYDAPIDFPLLTAAFAIAWVVGFVTPGAPAGIGVREALLLAMLGPSLGPVEAPLLILAMRIASTLSDALCFAIGLIVMARPRRAAYSERNDDD